MIWNIKTSQLKLEYTSFQHTLQQLPEQSCAEREVLWGEQQLSKKLHLQVKLTQIEEQDLEQ